MSSDKQRRGHRPGRQLATPLLLLLVAAFLPAGVDGVPLAQKLNGTTGVSQFYQVLSDSELDIQMRDGVCGAAIGSKCYTVFAPSNEAMSSAYSDLASITKSDKQKIVQHHYLSNALSKKKGLLDQWSSLGTPVGTDIGFGQVQIFQTPISTLYWLGKQTGGTWSYRINNAAIVVSDSNQEADNGVFHVLDQVALPIGTKQSFSTFMSNPDTYIINQLGISTSIRTFNDWMSRDPALIFVYDDFKSTSEYKVRTVFLPSETAWNKIPRDVMQQLNNSLSDRRKVIAAHFGLNISVFTGWMTTDSNINFQTGYSHTEMQTYNAKMYVDSSKRAFISVGGVVAQFVTGAIDYPIGDAVIHVVDRVLAFASDTLATLAQANAPSFYAKCIGVASCNALLNANDNISRTLFAPNDVTSLNGLNSSMLEQILKLHFVPAVIGKPDMTESYLETAQDSAGQIRFRMTPDKSRYFVEGRLPNCGFVRSELTMFDQPAKGGSIFHKILFPLGQPYQTVQDFINSFPDLSNVSLLMNSAFDPNLGTAGAMYSVFPPNNAALRAFASYKSTSGASVGQAILNSKNLRDRVFRRIVLPNQKIVADVAAAGPSEYATANTAENEKVSLNFKGPAGLRTRTVDLTGSFVSTNVSIAAGQYECTNGMVYPARNVLFRDTDVEGTSDVPLYPSTPRGHPWCQTSSPRSDWYALSAGSVRSSLAVAVFSVLLIRLAKM